MLNDQRNIEPISDGEASGRRASRSTYFIFEEPELYLHPQAQRELFSSLKALSESNNQVLLSTHSSSFIDLRLYKSICIVQKSNVSDGSKRLQCSEDLFTSFEDRKKFNMTYWVNPDRSELFFAKKIF
jgi:CRISPR-associated exonuclease Cas4